MLRQQQGKPQRGRVRRQIAAITAMVMVLAVSILVPIPVAEAQTIVIDDRVAAQADGVVAAVVRSSVTVELEGTPYTVQELDIDTVLAGSFPDQVRFVVPGGQRADGSFVQMSHVPEAPFVDESVQLALIDAPAIWANAIAAETGDDSPLYTVAGGNQGLVKASSPYVAQAKTDFRFNGWARRGYSPPTTFRVNPSNSGVNTSLTIAAVRAGFDRWEDDPQSDIDFRYGGRTSMTGLNFGDTTTQVSWEFASARNSLDPDALAVAVLDVSGSHRVIDIVLNRRYDWSIGAVPGHHDIETVIAHEVGHGIGLDHAYGAEDQLMFPTAPPNRVKEIGDGDISAARLLHPDPTPETLEEPGQSVAANASGDIAFAVLKGGGSLLVRSGGPWEEVGQSDWAAVDIAMTPGGAVHLAGIKADGRLFTRRLSPAGTWGGWTNHGSGWSTTTMPSIATNSTRVVLAAVRRSGALRTNQWSGSWAGFVSHGAPTWEHVDVDIAPDGDIWFTGVKTDGRLFVRKRLAGSGWAGFSLQGRSNWSTDTPPAIAAQSNGAVIAAVKEGGSLHTRHQLNGRWRGFVRQGSSKWSAVDVTMSGSGKAWLAASKDFGRLHTREATTSANWQAWERHGADNWTPHADPSVTAYGSGVAFVAVKEIGKLWLRTQTSGNWSWSTRSGFDWAIGS